MTSLDEYQWRYRRPAPPFHEAFGEMAGPRTRERRRRRRRGVLALVALLAVLGLAGGPLNGGAAVADSASSSVAAGTSLIRQVAGLVSTVPALLKTAC